MLNNVIALFTEPYKIELRKETIPIMPPEYVCVEYLYCGICGGDYSVYCGRRDVYPVSLGHEFVAKVIAVGNLVKDIRPGQYVISDFNYRCNECTYCKKQQSHLCQNNDIGFFSNRGFAKYANIHASYIIPINPPAYLPRACLIEPLSCVIHACHLSDIRQGMRILICGGGSLGMLFCFLLSQVYGNITITLKEIISQKSSLIYNHFPIQEYASNTNDDYDLIIDCSNTIDGLGFSLSKAKHGSKICIMSHLYGLDTSFVYEQVCRKELKCTFPLRNGEQDNLRLAAKYIERFWMKEYDDMLTVYDDISLAFTEKASSTFCKQIVHSSAL